MIRATLKGMLGRKLRTGLTAFAVLLGVAMVTGAYVITDTMQGAADELETASYSSSDAVVSARQAFDVDTNQGFSEAESIPAGLIERVRAVPQVASATAEINDSGQLVDEKGEVIGASGAPAFSVGFDSRAPGAEELSPFEMTTGRFPAGPGEIAVDAGTADNEDIGVGDRIGLAGRGPTRQYRVVGVATFRDVESIGSATLAIVELSEAQRLFRKEGKVDSILVKGDAGVEPRALADAIRPVLGQEAGVRTAEEQDRFDIGGLKEFLDIIQMVLIGFGLVSLFVGAFIIFNTLSITVAQRAREFGLMRMIGASRRQVLQSVVLEALVLGVLASVLGILAGIGLAKGLDAIFRSAGIDLPQSETVFATRTLVVALVVGIGVTLVAGLAPALRATRVAPVAALRETSLTDLRKPSRFTLPIGIAIIALGLVGLLYGMFASDVSVEGRLAAIGAGCLVLFVGVAIFSPRLARALAGLLGRPGARIAGAAGSLARQNAMRNPSRTATTAAALMIGLALVTFVAVLGQGLRSSFGDSLDQQIGVDYIVTHEDGFSPFSPETLDALARDDRVESVSFVREEQIKAFGDEMSINGVPPRTIGASYRFDLKGDAARGPERLGFDGTIVTERFAEDHDLQVGDHFEALTPSGDRLDLAVEAIDDRPPFNPLGLSNVTVSTELFDRIFQTRRVRYVFVQARGGASEATERALKQAIAPFADAKLQTQSAYREDAEADIEPLLTLLYVLLALSVIVSLFGIVNTLVLSVFERTRELGMLRAVGMTRRQVRRMVRHESIIVALIGATLGMAVGVFLAALVTQALSDEGVSFSLPVGSLIVFVIVAVLAGIVAAILPARRASRLDVLEALQYE